MQPEIANFTRVCSYDRAGLGWSEKCRAPRTVNQMVSRVEHPAFEAAVLLLHYILAGHSFGGLLIRAYAHLRPSEVAGLVFVDPVSLEYWTNCSREELRRLRLGTRLSRRGALLARLGIVRAALAALVSGGRFFPKLVARATAGQGTSVMEGLIGEVQKLPPEVWPMVRSHWSSPKCFQAMASYLEVLPESAQRCASSCRFRRIFRSSFSLPQLQLRLSWKNASRGFGGARSGRHIRVDQSGHWLQLERPDLVVAAVRELVDATRKPLS